MAANDAVEVARRFHDRTVHTPYSVHASGHTLDWDIKPFPFKIYPEAPALALPRAVEPVSAPTLAALSASPAGAGRALTRDGLAALLYFAAGVTRKKTYPGGGEVLFRAAASTGALYQTEVYVVVGDVEDVEPGVYHFSPGDFVLRRLRAGDLRRPLAEAAADESLARRSATVILTAIYWRNTWKYQARGYRHLFWDSGTMLANALAVGDALGFAPRLLTGFADGAVNHLLGLDDRREAALELLAIGPETAPAPPVAALEAIDPPVMALSSDDVDYPALREVHRASMLDAPEDVRRWRAMESGLAPRAGPVPPLISLPVGPEHGIAGIALGDAIQRRGSTRQFGHAPLTAAELGTALWAATRPLAADVPSGLVDLYLTVNAVEGVPPGAYRYWPERAGADGAGLELLREGDVRMKSAYLCLEQALGGDAAAVIFFLAPLDEILRRFGNRGYRLANLEAGIAGGRAYLAAYASGFGASGLTFYDGEVVEFFSPSARGKDAIFVTALGRTGRGPSAGVIPSTAIRTPPRRPG